MRKFFSLIAAVLFAGSMMADNYVLVSDASTLADGDQIIITNVVPDRAISTTQNSNNRGVAEVTPSEGVIVPGNDVQIITLVAADANFMLQVGENAYLYAASNSSNHLKTSTAATAGDNGKFAITITEGVAAVTAQGTNSRNSLRYNTSGMFSCYGSSSSVEAGLKIFKKEGGDVPPTPTMNYYVTGSMTNWAPNANYMLTPDNGGLYKGEFAFAANDEFKVTYSDGNTIANNNWFPSGMNNNYTITEAGDYTITFNPAGNVEGWYEGYFLVEKKVVTPISLTEFIATKPATEVTLKDLTVIYANGKNTYVIDEDGVALVIFDTNKTYYDGTLTAGKVLSGQKATYTSYKNQDEIIPTNAVVATDGVAPVPTKLTEKPTDAQVNKYIAYDNVAATLNNGKYYIFTDVQLYGATGALKPTAEGNYDVEGIYIVYNGTAPEIIVTALEESTTTAIDNAAIETKAIKRIENGKLVIIKNGVRFDAQGIRL